MEQVTPEEERKAKKLLLIEVLQELGYEIPHDGYYGHLPSWVNKKAHIITNARYDYFRRCYRIKTLLGKYHN